MDDNEYAKFGLPEERPKDPIEPCATAAVQRGWFLRNLWWLLLAVVLALVLPCGTCGGLFVWLIHSFKSSAPYQAALSRVQTAPQVIERLGEPIVESSWMPMGNFSYGIENGVASGEAKFSFSVAGPRGKANVRVKARCRTGTWSFDLLEVTPANTGEVIVLPADDKPRRADFQEGRFSWMASSPLVTPDHNATDPAISIKDPTIVRDHGRWHMFATVRLASGKVDIEYLNFADWKDADQALRRRLNLHDQYYCAPQVVYFRPEKLWYLIYQIADKNHKPPFGPGYSTTANLGDPKSWSKPRWLFPEGSEGHQWIDFWIICDGAKAHLFFTSNDGRMWRCETRLADFPGRWSQPVLALEADIFEASHTYRLKGIDKYLTIVEAQADARRYYKAYLADRLEGPWQGLADRRDKPFASISNIVQSDAWTTNVSHGELIRSGVDETMEIDPANLRFLFQGASDSEYRGNPYGKIPWRLGILEMDR